MEWSLRGGVTGSTARAWDCVHTADDDVRVLGRAPTRTSRATTRRPDTGRPPRPVDGVCAARLRGDTGEVPGPTSSWGVPESWTDRSTTSTALASAGPRGAAEPGVGDVVHQAGIAVTAQRSTGAKRTSALPWPVSSKTARTRRPIRTDSGLQPTMFVITRGPSSSST